MICEAPPSHTGQTYTALVKNFPPNPSYLKVGNVIADVGSNRRIPVRMCNISTKPIIIPRNCKLASVSLILQEDDTPNKPTMNQEDHHFMNLVHQVPSQDLTSIIPSLDIADISLKTEEQANKLASLFHEHKEVFSKNSLDYGCTSTVKHAIPLLDDQPFRLPYRRIPPSQFQTVKDHLKDMVSFGAICKSCSPYASPIVIAPKKDGSIRLCIDYRQLNNRTTRDAYPLPRIEEALMHLVTPSFSAR